MVEQLRRGSEMENQELRRGSWQRFRLTQSCFVAKWPTSPGLLAQQRMATVAENRDRWEHHDWTRQGDEWSPGGCAGGTRLLWLRTILTRVDRFLPTGT